MTGTPKTPVAALASVYDRLTDEYRIERLEHRFIGVAVLGLGVHLGLVALSRSGMLSVELSAAIGGSYLAALYTPFSFILFFEVLLMVLSLPESTTMSLGKQYQIVSLIILRSVFKDVAEFDRLPALGEGWTALKPILLDMGGGISMFALLGAFYHVSGRSPKLHSPHAHTVEHSAVLQHFINQKKALATLLATLLIGLAGVHLLQWSLGVQALLVHGVASTTDVDQIFYVDLFTVMVFIDVLVLLLSMRLDNRYQMVFRNAGYVIATILLRLSLSVDKPLDISLAVLAVCFGITVAATHRYWGWLDARGGHGHSAGTETRRSSTSATP